MACRVGMTTDPKGRKQYWKNKHPNLHGWEILGHYKTKSEAQSAEDAFAAQYKCVSHRGGGGDEHDDWVVYKFKY